MINVIISDNCKELITRLELPSDLVVSVFRNRTRGMITKANPPQIYATSWFSNGKIIFVNGTVTKHKIEGNKLNIIDVQANLGLELKEKLPAGNITREMPMEEILKVVAESFGVPVTCHPNEPPVKFYNGKWNGNELVFQVANGDLHRISGSFNIEKKSCNYVWVFSFNLYKNWFVSN